MNLLSFLLVSLFSLPLVKSAPQTSLFESVEVEALSREEEINTEVSTEVAVVEDEEEEDDDGSWIPKPNWSQWQVQNILDYF